MKIPPSPVVENYAIGFLNLCPGQAAKAQLLRQSLENAGMICCDMNLKEPGPVLIAIDDHPDENLLCTAVKDSTDKDHSVFLFCLNDARLPYYKIWDWLSLGVEDVWCSSEIAEPWKLLQHHLHRRATVEHFMDSEAIKSNIIGCSKVWRQALRQIVGTAIFSNAGILLLGESGTGKELAARLIHEIDRRPNKQDLILLDCTTVQPELSGSEFFGHEKGSYTHALSMREGAFALADGGTLFLDEIGELPLPLQAELLRVIQEGVYKRLGSNEWRRTKFRLICATNRDLAREVQLGRFRQDLYYRIKTSCCTLPPLRERREDIPELVEHFLKELFSDQSPPLVDKNLQNHLLAQPYPGNVRELRQLLQRLAPRYPGAGPLTIGCLPLEDREIISPPADWKKELLHDAVTHALNNGAGLKEIKRQAGDMALEVAVEATEGNLQAAARMLDVSDRVVQMYWAERGGR